MKVYLDSKQAVSVYNMLYLLPSGAALSRLWEAYWKAESINLFASPWPGTICDGRVVASQVTWWRPIRQIGLLVGTPSFLHRGLALAAFLKEVKSWCPACSAVVRCNGSDRTGTWQVFVFLLVSDDLIKNGHDYYFKWSEKRMVAYRWTTTMESSLLSFARQLVACVVVAFPWPLLVPVLHLHIADCLNYVHTFCTHLIW